MNNVQAMTLQQAIHWGSSRLQAAGDPEAKINAQLLLMQAAKIKRTQIWMQPQQRLTPSQQRCYKAWIAQRETLRPLGYIIGEQPFWGRDFLVREGVLIPRQDTEVLCQQVLADIGENARVLELCCGSGAVAVSIKLEQPCAQVSASDISPVCVRTAKDNAARHHAEITVYQSDLFDQLDNGPWDIVICNPPYIPTSIVPTLMKDVSGYEPHLALDGGEDGLYFYRRLAKQAPQYLAVGGTLYLEMGHDQKEKLAAIFAPPWTIGFGKDLGGRWRWAACKYGGKHDAAQST